MTLKQRCCNWKVMKNSEKLQPFCMFNKEHVFHLKKGEKKTKDDEFNNEGGQEDSKRKRCMT